VAKQNFDSTVLKTTTDGRTVPSDYLLDGETIVPSSFKQDGTLPGGGRPGSTGPSTQPSTPSAPTPDGTYIKAITYQGLKDPYSPFQMTLELGGYHDEWGTSFGGGLSDGISASAASLNGEDVRISNLGFQGKNSDGSGPYLALAFGTASGFGTDNIPTASELRTLDVVLTSGTNEVFEFSAYAGTTLTHLPNQFNDTLSSVSYTSGSGQPMTFTANVSDFEPGEWGGADGTHLSIASATVKFNGATFPLSNISVVSGPAVRATVPSYPNAVTLDEYSNFSILITTTTGEKISLQPADTISFSTPQ
jgi:hypothetical protein